MKYLLLILSLFSFNTLANNFSDLNFNGLKYVKKENINQRSFFELINMLKKEDVRFKINLEGYDNTIIQISTTNDNNRTLYFNIKDLKTLELFELNKDKFIKSEIITEQIKKLKMEVLKDIIFVFNNEHYNKNNFVYFDIVDNNFYGKSMGENFDLILKELLIIQRMRREAPITIKEFHEYVVKNSLSTKLEDNYQICANTIPTEIYKKEDETYPNFYTLSHKSQKTVIIECD